MPRLIWLLIFFKPQIVKFEISPLSRTEGRRDTNGDINKLFRRNWYCWVILRALRKRVELFWKLMITYFLLRSTASLNCSFCWCANFWRVSYFIFIHVNSTMNKSMTKPINEATSRLSIENFQNFFLSKVINFLFGWRKCGNSLCLKWVRSKNIIFDESYTR